MGERSGTLSEADLHAFVDNQVNAERREAIVAYLKTAPSDAARVDLWRRQNEAIWSVFSGVAKEPVPVWLTLNQIGVSRPVGRPSAKPTPPVATTGLRRWRRVFVQAAVSLGVAAAVALALPDFAPLASVKALAFPKPRFLTERAEDRAWRSFDQRVLEAHRTFSLDVDRPVELADESGAVLAPWFARKLDASFRVPRLTSLGWSLRGGRVTPSDSGPAALLVYEATSGDRLSLMVARTSLPADTTLLHDVDAGGVLRWSDGTLAFGIATTRSTSWLSRDASELHDAISGPAEDR